MVEDKILNITMSFGVSELNAQNNIEDNIKVVDGRLYKAKLARKQYRGQGKYIDEILA